tara:strand:+ start:844 stop:1038 length:195 start_codon:yes stop_codon:yes gene_type:complete
MGKSPPKPDTSFQDEQRAEREAEKEKIDRENKAKRRSIRARRTGFRSLLFNNEQGVTPKQETLG